MGYVNVARRPMVTQVYEFPFPSTIPRDISYAI